MQLNDRLAVSGMHHVIESLAIRRSRLVEVGIEADAIGLMTYEEKASLERVENQARTMKGVVSHSDVLEFDRLVALIGRMTGESKEWLRRLSLSRLRGMMDGLEN